MDMTKKLAVVIALSNLQADIASNYNRQPPDMATVTKFAAVVTAISAMLAESEK